jgi:predicted ester cyclase
VLQHESEVVWFASLAGWQLRSACNRHFSRDCTTTSSLPIQGGSRKMTIDPGIAVVPGTRKRFKTRQLRCFRGAVRDGFRGSHSSAWRLYRRPRRRSESLPRAAFSVPRFSRGDSLANFDGDRVTTFKTYHGTHLGAFWGLEPTGRKIHFETVDVMRVRNGKMTDHWGVANLFSHAQQLGVGPVLPKTQ